jgi:hypothetical protein
MVQKVEETWRCKLKCARCEPKQRWKLPKEQLKGSDEEQDAAQGVNEEDALWSSARHFRGRMRQRTWLDRLDSYR